MNILFPTWKSFGVEDIKETFEELGYKVSLYEREPKNYRIDPRYKSEIKKYIKENDIDNHIISYQSKMNIIRLYQMAAMTLRYRIFHGVMTARLYLHIQNQSLTR